VEQLKAESTGGAFNWERCRSWLPYRTAMACERRYYLYVRHKHEQDADDDDGDNVDDTDVRYYDPFREWATSPLAVDLAQASRVLGSSESLKVFFLPHHHHHTHTQSLTRTQVLGPVMTPTLQLFYDALQSLDIAQIMSVFQYNTTELLGNKCGPASSDLWSIGVTALVTFSSQCRSRRSCTSCSGAAVFPPSSISVFALRESSPICGEISNFYYRMKVRCSLVTCRNRNRSF